LISLFFGQFLGWSNILLVGYVMNILNSCWPISFHKSLVTSSIQKWMKILQKNRFWVGNMPKLFVTTYPKWFFGKPQSP
jgi:hypothetical protein